MNAERDPTLFWKEFLNGSIYDQGPVVNFVKATNTLSGNSNLFWAYTSVRFFAHSGVTKWKREEDPEWDLMRVLGDESS